MSVNSALSYGSKVASAGIGKSGSGGNAAATSTGPEELQNSVSKLQYRNFVGHDFVFRIFW